MPDTTAIRKMKLVRDWVMANEGKKPSQQALKRKDGNGTAAEQTLGVFLRDWKTFKGNNAYKQANKAECDFLMRHVAWWNEHAHGSKAERGADLTKKVNAMLQDGYGHKDEPAFEGKKYWPGGSVGSETHRMYCKMFHLVDGQSAESDVAAVLRGVDPNRAQWYKAQWTANRTATLAAHKKRNAEATARGHAKGVKKRKVGAGAAASSAVVDDEDEDDDDEDDDEDEDEDDDEDDSE